MALPFSDADDVPDGVEPHRKVFVSAGDELARLLIKAQDPFNGQRLAHRMDNSGRFRPDERGDLGGWI
jgi:hypothetical protein